MYKLIVACCNYRNIIEALLQRPTKYNVFDFCRLNEGALNAVVEYNIYMLHTFIYRIFYVFKKRNRTMVWLFYYISIIVYL